MVGGNNLFCVGQQQQRQQQQQQQLPTPPEKNEASYCTREVQRFLPSARMCAFFGFNLQMAKNKHGWEVRRAAAPNKNPQMVPSKTDLNIGESRVWLLFPLLRAPQKIH